MEISLVTLITVPGAGGVPYSEHDVSLSGSLLISSDLVCEATLLGLTLDVTPLMRNTNTRVSIYMRGYAHCNYIIGK